MPRILELFAKTSWLRMMRHKFRKGTMLFHEDNMTVNSWTIQTNRFKGLNYNKMSFKKETIKETQ